MDPLRLGRIIWAVSPGRRGDGKVRPMIVASPWREIQASGEVAVVVCSTSVSDPTPPDEIALPHDPGGKVVTRLQVPTVAVCN